MLRLTTAALTAAFVPVIAAAQLAPLAPALPRTHAPKPTSGAISVEDLKTRLYIYADDSMLGRETGTLGNFKATTYIAAELKKLGLVPAGDSGTYFQTIPLSQRSLAPNASIRVGTTQLAASADFLPVPPRSSYTITDSTFPVIYGGRLGEAGTLSAEQISGKLLILARENPRRQYGTQFPQWAIGAGAVALVDLDSLPAAARAALSEPQMSYGPVQPQSRRVPPIFYINTRAATALFNGKDINTLASGDSGATAKLTVSFTDGPAKYPARNVVGILRGSDPVLRNQYVAIGAHNDHVGVTNNGVEHDSLKVFNHIARIGGAESRERPATADEQGTINTLLAQLRSTGGNKPRIDTVFNGADDDGSGTVSVLEIAQYLSSLKVKPKRSIIFVWHTGEEKGLWGSEYFTDNPTVPRDSIVAQINMDMVGRGRASDIAGGKPGYLQIIGSRRLSTQLGDAIEKVNVDSKAGMDFDYQYDASGHPQQIYCRSDHYSYARYGIPVAFFTTGGHPDYHQLTDEAQYIDYDGMARVANFISNVMLNIGNMPERPVVDKPKPDPKGQCRQ